MTQELNRLFVCERCFSAAEQAGACPRCGQPRRAFTVGAPGDPRRRPPVDEHGRMCCRAPLWWVTSHAPYLRQR